MRSAPDSSLPHNQNNAPTHLAAPRVNQPESYLAAPKTKAHDSYQPHRCRRGHTDNIVPTPENRTRIDEAHAREDAERQTHQIEHDE